MKPIRVLLADNQRLVRAGIRSLLEDLSGIEVIGEASDAPEVFSMVAQHKPHIVLIELTLPATNDLELVRTLISSFPKVYFVILSVYSDEHRVYLALRAGAAGYIVKGEDKKELELAIRAVAQGATYISPSISDRKDNQPSRSTESLLLEKLTSRQIQILQLIAHGKSTKEIALELNISVKTVETHRMHLMDRLEIHEIAALVRFAIRVGLLRVEL